MLHLDFDLPRPKAEEIQVREFVTWAEMPLEFVIAGLGRCGTTSLRENLLRHPDVNFTVPDDDHWLWRHDRALPYRSDVEQLAAVPVTKANNLLNRLPHRSRGLIDRQAHVDARLQQAIVRMPDLRVLVVVCDPTSRFEKFVWQNHLCRPGRGLSGRDGQPCWQSMEEGLRAMPGFVMTEAAGVHLGSFLSLLGPRLHILHQDSLRFDGEQAYQAIATFLGLPPFQLGVEFRRHNSRPGHRTELCRNLSLLEFVKRGLEPEYRALEDVLRAAGLDVPESLRLRRTRCDRPDELEGR